MGCTTSKSDLTVDHIIIARQASFLDSPEFAKKDFVLIKNLTLITSANSILSDESSYEKDLNHNSSNWLEPSSVLMRKQMIENLIYYYGNHIRDPADEFLEL